MNKTITQCHECGEKKETIDTYGYDICQDCQFDPVRYSEKMDRIEKEMIERAKKYIANERNFKLFRDETGWEEWMRNFCSMGGWIEGAELSESESRDIDEFLESCWVQAGEEISVR